VALAWLIARPGITSPIASVTNARQMGDLVEAANIELDRDSIEKLSDAAVLLSNFTQAHGVD
jgi:aryl-alcohol dehydrogenase-like predicted oxidoreductase